MEKSIIRGYNRLIRILLNSLKTVRKILKDDICSSATRLQVCSKRANKTPVFFAYTLFAIGHTTLDKQQGNFFGSAASD
jgi:hypothetical protein